MKHARFLRERTLRRQAEAKVDAYDLNAMRTDHDVVGPVMVRPALYDVDQVEPDLNGWAAAIAAPGESSDVRCTRIGCEHREQWDG